MTCLERARATRGERADRFTQLRRVARSAVVAGLCLLGTHAYAAMPVEAVGLFKNQAVVRVAGNERLLKVGETSPEGVRLISADARGAIVTYRGERYELSLSQRVAGAFKAAPKPRVSIAPDDLGQYRVSGRINNRTAHFLVDTGASVVAMSSAAAEGLGIDYRRGELGSVQTAQGTTQSHFVILDEISVAGITAHNVQAAIITGRYPVDILLGMSFLRQVSLEENGGVMTLVQKF